MKRCPQCEFIYEDDQSLCDMDGVLLVFDSRTLPSLHALATVSAPLPEKGPRRSRMVPAFATLIAVREVEAVTTVSSLMTFKVKLLGIVIAGLEPMLSGSPRSVRFSPRSS